MRSLTDNQKEKGNNNPKVSGQVGDSVTDTEWTASATLHSSFPVLILPPDVTVAPNTQQFVSRHTWEVETFHLSHNVLSESQVTWACTITFIYGICSIMTVTRKRQILQSSRPL